MANDFEVAAEPTVGETEITDRCAFIPDAMLGDEGGGVGEHDAPRTTELSKPRRRCAGTGTTFWESKRLRTKKRALARKRLRRATG